MTDRMSCPSTVSQNGTYEATQKKNGQGVSSSLPFSPGLTYVIRKASRMDPIKRLIIQRFVPLPATSLASSLNVLCMRWNELGTGIAVYDSSRNVVGISKVAAKQANSYCYHQN